MPPPTLLKSNFHNGSSPQSTESSIQVEYTPLQVKQAVVGYGRADKKQVQNMVKAILGLESIPKPDDAADALAVAICCESSLKFEKRVNGE